MEIIMLRGRWGCVYPMKLTAVCKDRIWGGTRLRDEYGMCSESGRIAEGWVLSCRKDADCVIENGSFAGRTLSDYISEVGTQVLGTSFSHYGEDFPVLIKLIDARAPLSVQVHPDNAYAKRAGDESGKDELWYVVDCDENAGIIYGFNRGLTREEFSERIKNNTLTEVTNNITVHKGDVFYIGAGTLHAIGAGILMAEIQQNSDTTYRVYDYGRVGADGKPRELHTEKACDVTKLGKPEYPTGPAGKKRDMGGYDITLLASCAYFTSSRLDVRSFAELNAGSASFDSVIVLDGAFTVGDVRLEKGGSLFVPAGFGKYTLVGSGEAILTNIV